jgi:hypothetical protein
VIVDFPKKEVMAHAFERAENDWYQEPSWCAERLFEEEKFEGSIWDPACGGGNIPEAAKAAGYDVAYSDIVNRGYLELATIIRDFFTINEPCDNIVTNPPFNRAQLFAEHALELARGKVAMIFPTRRLNAAKWLEGTPLRRIWFLTPRPSMPPGEAIAAGQKPGGGKVDFCWVVWERGYKGEAHIHWLHRDRSRQK